MATEKSKVEVKDSLDTIVSDFKNVHAQTLATMQNHVDRIFELSKEAELKLKEAQGSKDSAEELRKVAEVKLNSLSEKETELFNRLNHNQNLINASEAANKEAQDKVVKLDEVHKSLEAERLVVQAQGDEFKSKLEGLDIRERSVLLLEKKLDLIMKDKNVVEQLAKL